MYKTQHHRAIRKCGKYLLIPSRRVWDTELPNVYAHDHNRDDVESTDDPAGVILLLFGHTENQLNPRDLLFAVQTEGADQTGLGEEVCEVCNYISIWAYTYQQHICISIAGSIAEGISVLASLKAYPYWHRRRYIRIGIADGISVSASPKVYLYRHR